MKSGYSKTLDMVLKQFGMTPGQVVCEVWSNKPYVKGVVSSLGYKVENDAGSPLHGFILLSYDTSTVENIKKALTKLDNGCIIVFRVNSKTIKFYGSKTYLKYSPYAYYYGNNKYLGVIIKNEGKS